MDRNDPMSDEQRNILQDCVEVENMKCNYHDSLISCMNSVKK